jgi:hypothetical protein
MEDETLYQRFLAEREEILKHKWIESEKRGYDMGFEKAIIDWMTVHRKNWLAANGHGTPNQSSQKEQQ